jgi:hypothetical protein
MTATTETDALELGRGLPGWTLRALIAMVAGVIVAVLAVNGIAGAALVLVGIAALLSAGMPASPAPTLMIVLVAMAVVALGADPFRPHVLVLVPLVHLLHVGCAIAGLLPARSRVHLTALRVPAMRFAAIQAGVFALAGTMALVPAGRASAVLELIALVGVALAVPLVWLLVRPH